jgi:hypothetical protein
MVGPGSSLMIQLSMTSIVSVFADCALHITEIVLTTLSANDSMSSFTQGEFSERHFPGNGEVATWQ